MNEMTRLAGTPDSYKARFTTAEFLHMVDADAFGDARIELVDGELERMPPPKNTHSLLQGAVYAQLVAAKGVDVARVEIGIDLGEDTVLGADVALLRAPLPENRWPRADEVLLAVEVSETTLARDLGMKTARYAAADVPHCWVVDGSAAVIHVFDAPAEARYTHVAVVRFGEPLAVPGTDATITLS